MSLHQRRPHLEGCVGVQLELWDLLRPQGKPQALALNEVVKHRPTCRELDGAELLLEPLAELHTVVNVLVESGKVSRE